jgi:autotransporter-associated beta strand protein
VFNTGADAIVLSGVTSTTVTGTVTKVGTGTLTFASNSTLGGSLEVTEGALMVTALTGGSTAGASIASNYVQTAGGSRPCWD